MKKLLIAAAFALALAAASGAFAAHKYLVTSSEQIKPGTVSLANLSPAARKALLGHSSASTLAGPQGPAGKDGVNGSTGPQGPKGDGGPQGSAGKDGINGAKGADGAPGPKGDTGQQGPQGPAGKDGIDGAKGADGAPGPKGDKGDSGINSPLVFGPYDAKGADSNSCGGQWASDTYKVTFVVSPQSDGSFTVSELFNGSFVTNAADSPATSGADCGDPAKAVPAGVTGQFYGDYVVPVQSASDFNPNGVVDDSTPCGATCTSNKFYKAVFGKTDADYLNSRNYAWQFHYRSASGGSWNDTDHGSSGNITG